MLSFIAHVVQTTPKRNCQLTAHQIRYEHGVFKSAATFPLDVTQKTATRGNQLGVKIGAQQVH